MQKINTLLDPTVNFGKVTTYTGYTNLDTVIVLNSGDGAKLPTTGTFNLVWYDSTDYPDPSDDPFVEIVRCTSRMEDVLTVTRAQEGTLASNKNTPGKTYKMILSPTKKTIDDINIEKVSKSGDTMTGILNLPINGLIVGTNQLITSGSKVGIGITTPNSPLHISISESQTNPISLGISGLTIQNMDITSGNSNGIEFWNNEGARVGAIYTQRDSTTQAGSLLFGTHTGIAFTEKMRITSGGNVGIGTTSPGFKLTVDNGTIVSGDVIALIGDSGTAAYRLGLDGTGSESSLTFVNINGLERMRITNDGKLGIGTTFPTEALHVSNGNIFVSTGNLFLSRYGAVRMNYDGTNTFMLGGDLGIAPNLYLNRTGGTGNFIIASGGIQKVMFLTSTYDLLLQNDSAAKPGTNTWTISSDERIKKDIRPFTDSLDIIRQINPIWYRYNGKGGFEEDGKDHVGVIGQDIQKIAPYTINTYKAKLNPDDKEDTELLNFNSHALTFVLINAVKDLKIENDKLKNDMAALRKELVELRIQNMQ